MDIEQAVAAKYEMEDEICAAMQLAISKFSVRTGLAPSAINVRMCCVQTLGEPVRYVLQRVVAEVSL